MKKLSKILLSLFILALAFLGVFLVVNLWPRAVEPPLWTQADLELPQDKDQNGYYFMLQMQQNPLFDRVFDEIEEGMEIPGDLEPFTPRGFPVDPTDRTLFWMDAKGLQPVFSAFVEKHRPEIDEYQKLLAFSQFVDQTPTTVDTGPDHPKWLFFMDLHKLGSLHIFDLLLKGNTDSAYAFWLNMWNQDLSLLKSARGLLTNMIALSVVKGDLLLLDGIRQFPPSAELQTKIGKALQDFDPTSFDMRRAVIAEYLQHQSSADSIAGAAKKENGLWARVSFNRAVFQREENDYFRRLDAYRKDPKSITDQVERQFEEEGKKLSYAAGSKHSQVLGGKHDPFWWFFNPSGKLLRAIITVSFVGRINEFHHNLEDIQKLKSQLLAGPLFASAPETQISETQSSETHPAETRPAESKKMDPADIQKDAL